MRRGGTLLLTAYCALAEARHGAPEQIEEQLESYLEGFRDGRLEFCSMTTPFDRVRRLGSGWA
jgi:hypothetical protein